MSEPKLFLVTTYDEVYKAELAKTALEDEGIFVVLHDRETVATDWLISNAVGGVKLKVRQEDAERACQILTDKMSNPSSYLAESLSDEELTRQALAEPMEDGTIAPTPAPKVVSQVHLEESPTEEAYSAIREVYALRFFENGDLLAGAGATRGCGGLFWFQSYLFSWTTFIARAQPDHLWSHRMLL